MPTTTLEDDRLDQTFAALANTTRRAILARLARGTATVNELAEPFDMSLPAVSKHLKVLERAGLVERSRHSRFRPCALDPEPLAMAAAWAEQCRVTWQTSFDRMDQHLRDLQTEPMTTDSEDGSAR